MQCIELCILFLMLYNGNFISSSFNLKMKERTSQSTKSCDPRPRPCLFWSQSGIFKISIWSHISLLGVNFVGARIDILVKLICRTIAMLTVTPNLAIFTLYLHCANNGACIFASLCDVCNDITQSAITLIEKRCYFETGS